MAQTTVSLKRSCTAILIRIRRVMRRLHPRINPKEHVDILKTICNLTVGGTKTTVSQVIEELRVRGICAHLSDGQIRRRIKDLEKKSYIIMEYPPGKPRLFFVHPTLGFVRSWSHLWILFKQLISCLKKNTRAKALVITDMKTLGRMIASKDFIGFIRTYNSILKKIGRTAKLCRLHLIEFKGLAKRIELTRDGWDVCLC